jgi:hypothetical protein
MLAFSMNLANFFRAVRSRLTSLFVHSSRLRDQADIRMATPRASTSLIVNSDCCLNITEIVVLREELTEKSALFLLLSFRADARLF